MVSDGEAKTEARERKGEPCSASHGEHHSGEVTARATLAKMAKGPYLWLVWLSEGDGKVHGVLAELWASWSEVRRDGERTRARRGNGDGDGDDLFFSVLRTPARGRKRLRASEEAAGILFFTPASAQCDQGQPSAWRPRGGNGLRPVGHCAGLKIPIQSSSMPTNKASS